MDLYWQAVAAHVRQGAPGRLVVGPEELGLRTVSAQRPLDPAQVDVLVLHKDRFRTLPRPFLKAALKRMRPSFGNEVFIVLDAGAKGAKPSRKHLGALREMKRWADAPDGHPDTAPGGASPRRRGPMARLRRFGKRGGPAAARSKLAEDERFDDLSRLVRQARNAALSAAVLAGAGAVMSALAWLAPRHW